MFTIVWQIGSQVCFLSYTLDNDNNSKDSASGLNDGERGVVIDVSIFSFFRVGLKELCAWGEGEILKVCK